MRSWGRTNRPQSLGPLASEGTDKIQSYQYLSYATLEVSSFVCGVSSFFFLLFF